jgi:hypothetical protein
MLGNEDEFHGGSFAIPRVTLRALAGNSISHFSLADAEGNAVGVPLRATKMETKAGKVKFHIR